MTLVKTQELEKQTNRKATMFWNHYRCSFCKTEFERKVGTFNHISDQVVCPSCGNFIKTWE